jgi:hypothetical protein
MTRWLAPVRIKYPFCSALTNGPTRPDIRRPPTAYLHLVYPGTTVSRRRAASCTLSRGRPNSVGLQPLARGRRLIGISSDPLPGAKLRLFVHPFVDGCPLLSTVHCQLPTIKKCKQSGKSPSLDGTLFRRPESAGQQSGGFRG